MKKNILRIVIYLVLLLALTFGYSAAMHESFAGIGDLLTFVDGRVLVQLLLMALTVLLLYNIVMLPLGLIRPKSHRAGTILSLMSSLAKYVAAIAALCWGLSIAGVNVSTILASVGLLALIVGFGAESLISDVITGIFMLFENQYNVGDIIEVNGFRGTVSGIGIRTTSITDVSGNIKIINNSSMTNILNRSDNSSTAVCDFPVPYSTDLESLEKALPALLQDIFTRHQEEMLAPPQYAGVQQLGDSAVLLRFVVEVPETAIYSSVRSMNRELFLGMKRLGIECPFPQVEVHSAKQDGGSARLL